MVTVTQNKLVYITYSILDSRGMVVEQHDIPVGYVQGANSGILPAIESAVAGRKIGERVEIALSPEEGYGLRDESLVFVDDIENVPPEFRRVGAEVMFENASGETKVFYVTSIEDGKLTLDGNPVAGGAERDLPGECDGHPRRYAGRNPQRAAARRANRHGSLT